MNGPAAAVVAKLEAVAEFAPPWAVVLLALGGLVLIIDGLAALHARRARGITIAKGN